MKPLLVTFGLTGYGAVAALFNPYAGFLAYVCLALLKPDSLWEWTVPMGSYSRIVAICMLIGWALQGFGDWRFGKARIIVIAIMGYWIWSSVCASQAVIQPVAWKYVETITKIALPWLVGITMINSVDRLKQLAWVIVLSQGYVAFEMNLSYFEGFNRVKMTGFGGMEEGSISIYAVTGAGVALHLGMAVKSLWQRLICYSAALMLAHVPMMSDSRGGMIGLLLAGAVSFLIIPKRPRHIAAMIVAVLLGLQLAGPSVRDRFMTSFNSEEERDVSAASRVYLWGRCWDMMLDEPVFGVGPDHFPFVISRYGRYDGIEAHTLWLQVGAELGFLGLISLGSFYALTAASIWKYTSEKTPVPDPMIRSISRMVISSLVAFAVSAQFISLEGLEAPYYVALLGAGALKLLSMPPEETLESSESGESDDDGESK